MSALQISAGAQVKRERQPSFASGEKFRIVTRIDEPNVRQAKTSYEDVRFQPEDIVTITAGGCVQTGGVGKTWKRYVDPLDGIDDYFHGLVQIPGATDNLPESPIVPGYGRLSSIVGRRLIVPKSADPKNLFLRLGYEDRDYADNGYHDHDDGVKDQCKGLENAYVIVTIERRTSSQAPRLLKARSNAIKEHRSKDVDSGSPTTPP